jgi:hypothetical protein
LGALGQPIDVAREREWWNLPGRNGLTHLPVVGGVHAHPHVGDAEHRHQNAGENMRIAGAS